MSMEPNYGPDGGDWVCGRCKVPLEQIKTPVFYLGGFLYFAAAVLNIYVLRFLDYSVAFPLKAFTYIWTVLLAYLFFKESLTKRELAGVVLIVIGAVLISM